MSKINFDKIKREISKSKNTKIILYIGITLVWITLSILLLILSKEKYLANLIIDIVLSILYISFSIYFFTNILKKVLEEEKNFNTILNAQIDKYFLFYKSVEMENDLYIYLFKDLLNNAIKLKSFERIDFSNNKYLIESKINYIVSWEESHE